MLKSELIAKTAKVKAAQRTASTALDDATALEAMAIFEEWTTATTYAVNDRIRYGEKLYKCVQAHTSQTDWTPDVTPALWEVVTIEDGSREHPIAYTIGMVLESGRYYSEDGKLYLCNRDTGVPVYNRLADLVGIYVVLADA